MPIPGMHEQIGSKMCIVRIPELLRKRMGVKQESHDWLNAVLHGVYCLSVQCLSTPLLRLSPCLLEMTMIALFAHA